MTATRNTKIEKTDPLIAGITGLGAQDIARAVSDGAVNHTPEWTSRSLKSILVANIFTRFNAILGVLLVLILIVGSPRDALFGIILVLNTAIGIVQEWRAKITLDRLSILSAATVRVVRSGALTELAADALVLGDRVVADEGDQIVTDGQLVAVAGLEVDESLLTGESVPVTKAVGDEVLSGSFVVAGRGVYETDKVGEQAYATKLSQEARQFHLSRSELQDSINLLLRVISWLMAPVAAALYLAEYRLSGSFSAASVSVVSGLVGMIPQGLVLLTSMAFAISIIRLGQRKVLVQELPAVEALARVDVVCFDKTGTLTTGRFTLDRIEAVQPELPVDAALGAFVRAFGQVHDPMLETITNNVEDPGWESIGTVAFSPVRKWSAATFAAQGTWVLGAPEALLAGVGSGDKARALYRELAAGHRVLLLAKSLGPVTEETLSDLTPAAFVLLKEQLRSDAADTIAYFHAQGVSLKVISGDSPLTVASIARDAGLVDASDPVDGGSLTADSHDLGHLMEDRSVFGRIGPQQKKAMIEALQARGHTVAMLGDGVNDVLAIKQADLGITVGSAASASKAVAQIILTDGRFSVLPEIVAEGRRILANIERVAALFLTKTVYSTLLIVVVSLLQWPFPLLPRHFTLIDAFTIGTPAFLLSLGPSSQVFRPGILTRLLRFTLPAGLMLALAVIAGMWAMRSGFTLEEQRSVATLILSGLGLVVLSWVARPLLTWRGLMVIAMGIGVAVSFALPLSQSFFALSLPAFAN